MGKKKTILQPIEENQDELDMLLGKIFILLLIRIRRKAPIKQNLLGYFGLIHAPKTKKQHDDIIFDKIITF